MWRTAVGLALGWIPGRDERRLRRLPDFAALIEDECERREDRAREAEFNRMSTLVSALDEKGGLELLPPAMQDRSHLEKLMDEYGI